MGTGGSSHGPVGLRRVFAVVEFRAIWAAELLSVAGDQVARVALAVLVFARTDSAAWSAAVYALTFLPALAGGLLLGWVADRFRRREVMVLTDVLRAAGTAVLALPGLPLGWLLAVLALVVLLGAPHAAAQGALLPQVLAGELYERGLAVRQMTTQAAQLVGFTGGGLVVAVLGAPAALLADAATFAAAAAILRWGLGDRPAPERADRVPDRHAALGGLRTVVADPLRRALVLLAWTVGWFVVPEGLAAPYAEQLGAGPAVVGLLMAADPLGSVVGAFLFVRYVPRPRREQLVGVLAALTGLPLVAVVLAPGVGSSLVLWAIAGACSTAYLLQTQAGFVRATPVDKRGAAIGIAASGIVASQGVAVAVGGVLADRIGPVAAVAVCGGLGTVLAAAGAVAHARARAGRDGGRPAGRSAVPDEP